jgi:hypothetical protein
MQALIAILFCGHLMGLALGGAAGFGNAVVGRRLLAAAPDVRTHLFGISHGLAALGKVGMGLLIVTGPLLIWLQFGGVEALSWVFWLKMVLLVALIADIIVIGRMEARAEGGDLSALKRMPILGGLSILLLIGIVLCAVVAFG